MNRHIPTGQVCGPVNCDCPRTAANLAALQEAWLRSQATQVPVTFPRPNPDRDFTEILEARAALAAERRELAELRKALHADRYLNAAGTLALIVWTTYCQGWSRLPAQVTGGLFLAAVGLALYYHCGRRWLQGA